jgi:hypothetical protein
MDGRSKRMVTFSLYELVCPLPKDVHQVPDIVWQDIEEERSQLAAQPSGQRCEGATYLPGGWTLPTRGRYGEPGLLLHSEFAVLRAWDRTLGCGEAALKSLPLLGGHVAGVSDPVATETRKGTPHLRRCCQQHQEQDGYQRQTCRAGATLVRTHPHRCIAHDAPNFLSSPAGSRLPAWVPRLAGCYTPDAPLSSSHRRGLEEGTQNAP